MGLENSVNHYLIWKINSHLIQVIEVPRQSEHMLTDRTVFLHLTTIELVGDIISLDPGMSLENKFQLLEPLICSMAFKTFFKSRF